MKTIKRRSYCPISSALDIFGDKWTLLIIRDLLFRGKIYYGDFMGSEERIATNILADRLQLLKSVGIITSAKDKRTKNKIVYSLTPKGIDLMPILLEIIQWSAKYIPKVNVQKEFVEQIRRDRSALEKQIRDGLKSNTLILSDSNSK